MRKAFELTLMIGPAVPIPAPQSVVDALTSVQVTSASGGRAPSGFQLNFTLSNNSPLHAIFLLSGGSVLPLMRVILIVTINGTPETLIDGVVTKQSISPGSDSSNSNLTVTGVDLTAVMDLIDFSGVPYPTMPAEARVALCIAKYAMFGLIPMVIPSVLIDVPIPTERIPRHQGTDLAYINQLADDVGYVFYLTPGPAPGTSIAYWGPEIKVGPAQPALNINFDGATNSENISFSFDTESKTLPVLFIQNLITKVPIPIPVPDITPLNPLLGTVPPIPKKIDFITGTAKLNPIQAALIGLAKAAKSSDAVSANGTLDVMRYGRILKSRQLVGVRGAGNTFDGLYYVKSVTHEIKRGEYKQSFSLTRNGLISTLAKVTA